MFKAEILADGVSGVLPLLFGGRPGKNLKSKKLTTQGPKQGTISKINFG